ncbi:glycosyltransferase family 4 protein [Ferdinandcohnia quinoae]|uniref:Glycosyltransferase family 4 protein n=1 Tax=Fredinandcohnia quinoae TaxID=2918902 RepID=A0AAW5E4I5_9BACI|nr:glycosyltransferase family 4 protein [Fredinandcohnia sp. SECRCQ15]MCH1624891.1 glycosyltransferase family 4 protein [Fredinandcohnia sp. SECRCQ15]
MKRKKICIVTTISLTMHQFIIWSLEDFHKNGFDVTLLCDMDDEFIKSVPEYVNCIPVRMSRGVNIWSSILAIFSIYKAIKKEKFDIIQYSTPNASLYTSLASWFARVPIRLYCQWGIIYVGMTGMKRRIFKIIEKLVCSLSTDIQPDSHGNLIFCRNEGIYNIEKSRVVWNGSASGVNLKKFDINKKQEYNIDIRKKYNISETTVIIGFFGRVGAEKGFNELILAFQNINQKYPNTKLLFVGPNEKPKTVDPRLLSWFEESEDVLKVGWTDEGEKYLAAMDVFVFPSYREGFGNVVIEAGAMGVPVIASDIPGPQNGIVDGVTGYLVPVKSVDHLVKKIELLYKNRILREKIGFNARKLVEENFDHTKLLEKMIENRKWLINRQGSA